MVQADLEFRPEFEPDGIVHCTAEHHEFRMAIINSGDLVTLQAATLARHGVEYNPLPYSTEDVDSGVFGSLI